MASKPPASKRRNPSVGKTAHSDRKNYGPLIGKTLGPYRIDEAIGRGGMATVYRAVQPSLHRSVALKVLHQSDKADEDFIARFRQEATILAGLQHPNIVPVYDFGEQDGIFYIVTMLVADGTLRARLQQPLEVTTAMVIASRVAAALDYAHRHEVLHHDVKPSNILMGDSDWPLLSDFGIAEIIEGPISGRNGGFNAGTAPYMSPERFQKASVDARSDVYALSVVLYEMLTGRLPHDGASTHEVLQRRLSDSIIPPSALRTGISPAIDEIVMKALAGKASDRYQTAFELKSALDRESGPLRRHRHSPLRRLNVPRGLPSFRVLASKQGTRSVADPGPIAPTVRRRRDRTLWPGVIALGLLLAGLAGWVFLSAGNRGPGPALGGNASVQQSTDQAEARESTVGATPATTDAGSTQSPPADTHFEDTFTDPQRGGWHLDRGRVYFEDQKLHINLSRERIGYATTPANAAEADNFVYEAVVTKIGGPDAAAYGLLFRGKGVQEFYFFGITGDGQSGVSKLRNGTGGPGFEPVIGPADTPAIQKGNGATNTLKVETVGTHFAFAINDQYVSELDDDFSAGGSFGLAAESGIHMAASSVKVTKR